MQKIKRVVVIDNFEQPESCWDCPILKTNVSGDVFCGLLGERKGKIKEYEHGFIRSDCKLDTIAFAEKFEDEDLE